MCIRDSAYTLKTGKDAADVAAIMAAETWYDGKQAVDAGFCDKLMFEDAETTVENAAKVVVNSVSLDLTRFPNMPVSLLNRMTARTPGGFSNKTNHKNTEKERNTICLLYTSRQAVLPRRVLARLRRP